MPEQEVTEGTKTDVKRAVERARTGFESLSKTGLDERLNVIEALKKEIIENRDWIIDEIQNATGKTCVDALVSEVFSVLDHLEYLENNAEEILSDRDVRTPWALMGKDSKIYYEPLGVLLIIAPWNYPFYQAVVPITSALVAGNSVLFKPSEYTPMEGVVEEFFERAGCREGWVNVVYGGGEVGAELIDQRPDKIFFTGSQSTGKKIMRQASKHLIPVDLELGGKDPMIVFEDVNIDRAASGAVWGAFTNAGQACTSVEKLYVHHRIYDAFKEAVVEKTNQVKLGTDTPSDLRDMGSMTTDFQLETVRRHLEDAREKGAEIISDREWDRQSKQIPPMVLDGVTEEMEIAREETFGPLLPLYRFEDEEEVVKRANDTEYGLSASVWSADLDRADRVARGIETGNVSINNVMVTQGNPALPFGGVKSSGFGRYKGEYGLRSFCNIKSVMSEDDSENKEANWFPYDDRKYELFNSLIDNLFTGGAINFLKFVVSGLKLDWYSSDASRNGKEDT